MAVIKIVKRTSESWAVIFYTYLTFLFYFIINSLFKYQTALNIHEFKEFFNENFVLFCLFLLLSISIFFFLKVGLYLYLITYGVLVLKVVQFLVVDFNKLIFLALFIFLLFSYFYYFQIKKVYSRSFYTPNISPESLDLRPFFGLAVKVQETGGNSWVNGVLTNWDERGCFILFRESTSFKKKYLNCKIEFNGAEFLTVGKIYSKYNDIGVGIVFVNRKSDSRNWKELYKVLADYGHTASEFNSVF